MSSSISYQKSIQSGTPTYHLSGVINENADLTFLAKLEPGTNVINTREVERINSCGVREWISALKSVPEGATIKYRECSAAFLDQINMISNFLGNGTVESLFIPYLCESCGAKKDSLIELEVCFSDDELELPELACTSCEDEMELADDPEQLFSFLE